MNAFWVSKPKVHRFKIGTGSPALPALRMDLGRSDPASIIGVVVDQKKLMRTS